MKRIIMLGIVLVTMLVSIGGCYWRGEERDRVNKPGKFDSQGYDRGEGSHDPNENIEHDDTK
jgi:hypothetical protein